MTVRLKKSMYQITKYYVTQTLNIVIVLLSKFLINNTRRAKPGFSD